MRHLRKSRAVRMSAALALAAVILVIFAAALDACATSRTGDVMQDRRFNPADAPERDVAVVLGASPGPLLAQRMDAGCALVAQRKVKRLVLTGMVGEMPYMRARATACGLAAEDILVDDGATRTLENLRRARDLFGVTRALVVTQEFHIGRALYLADALGIDAVGVVADGAPRALSGRLRERAARIRAVIDVALLTR